MLPVSAQYTAGMHPLIVYRMREQLSQAEAAEKIGISQRTVAHVETGAHRLLATTAWRIAATIAPTIGTDPETILPHLLDPSTPSTPSASVCNTRPKSEPSQHNDGLTQHNQPLQKESASIISEGS